MTPRRSPRTTRLGFESYLAWAPEGWQPPPRSLEIRARSASGCGRATTWCAMAIEPDGAQAGHVGITHASERERPHVHIPGRAHLWMLFVRPPWWGTGLAARLHRLALEEAARQELRHDPALHAARRGARTRVLRARGLGTGRAGVPRTAARAGPRRVPSRRCDPGGDVRGRRGALAGLDGHALAARADGLAHPCAGRDRRRGRLVDRQVGAGATTRRSSRPSRRSSRSGRATTSVGGGRPSSSSAVTLGGSPPPTCWRSSSAPARRSSRWRCSSRSGSACSSGPARCSSTRSRSRPCSCSRSRRRPAGSRSRARSTRWSAASSRWPVAAVVLPADPLRLLRDAARPVLDELCGDAARHRGRAAPASTDAAEAALVRARGIDEFGERFFAATHESRATDAHVARAQAHAGHDRVLRGGRGADRPGRAQRARAGARRDAGAGAGRERPAGGGRRARGPRARRARAGGGAGDRRGLRRRPRARPAGRRDRHPGARRHDQPVRQRDRRARSARPRPTC